MVTKVCESGQSDIMESYDIDLISFQNVKVRGSRPPLSHQHSAHALLSAFIDSNNPLLPPSGWLFASQAQISFNYFCVCFTYICVSFSHSQLTCVSVVLFRRWSSSTWSDFRSTTNSVRLGWVTVHPPAEALVGTETEDTWRTTATTRSTPLATTHPVAEDTGAPTTNTLDLVRVNDDVAVHPRSELVEIIRERLSKCMNSMSVMHLVHFNLTPSTCIYVYLIQSQTRNCRTLLSPKMRTSESSDPAAQVATRGAHEGATGAEAPMQDGAAVGLGPSLPIQLAQVGKSLIF